MNAALLRRLVLAAATTLAIASAGCSKVKYEVKGSGTATITYKDGTPVTVKDAKLPWSIEVMGGSKLEVSAKGTGELECSITRPGKGVMGYVNKDQCTVDAEN